MAPTPVQPLLVMMRVIDAPRAAVFEAWTRPERLARWWDLSGAPARPLAAGHRRRCIEIHDVEPPQRIVFSWGGERAETRTLITVVFVDDGARTRLILEQSVARAPEGGAVHRGWSASLDRLRGYLAELGYTIDRTTPPSTRSAAPVVPLAAALDA